LAELRVALNNAQQLNSAEQLDHYEDLIRELDEQLQQIGRHQRREGTPSEFF
jgi:flagellin-specific chaperone FliS